jgi:cephalosporin hydroxylase
VEAFPLAVGGYPGEELQFMCDTMERLRPDFVAEWGTGSGCSARIFWECDLRLGFEAAINTTELPDELRDLDGQHPGVNCGMHIKDTGVFAWRGDGVTESLIRWKRQQPRRPLFFLDGDHSAVMVTREIALIQRLVPDAPMLIHDTNGAGPGDAARTWAAMYGRSWSEVTERVGMGLLE